MAKDPAMLWYFSDWHSGTSLMSRFIKGCYIDLLHAQFNHGHLSLEDIKTCLGSDFGQSWPTLQKKFKKDSEGFFFNERLEQEKIKRQNFVRSRSNNLNTTHKDEHMESHMKPHMENRNKNEIKDGIEERKLKFINGLQIFSIDYANEMLTEFAEYWTEHGEKDKLMRFEKETSFNTSLRLKRWKRNQKVKFNGQTSKNGQPGVSDQDILDAVARHARP